MTEQTPDLTTDEAVATSQQVYDQLVAREVTGAPEQLDQAHGRP